MVSESNGGEGKMVNERNGGEEKNPPEKKRLDPPRNEYSTVFHLFLPCVGTRTNIHKLSREVSLTFDREL